jgi:hypothetical protein
MGLSSIPRGVGHNFTPEYQISAVPYSRTTDQSERIVVKDADGSIVIGGNPALPGAGNTTIRRILLPKISSWIQFTATSAVNVYFSKKDALTPTSANSLTLEAAESTLPLKIRCSTLYFIDAVANDLQINVGLTTIESSEFTETVETFLGDN